MWYNFCHIQLMDESNWIWYLYVHCQLLESRFQGALACYYWIFEATNTSETTLVELMNLFLTKFELANKIFACVKDKGKNLATLNFALSNVVFYHLFSWKHHCLAHVLGMWYQRFANMIQMKKRFINAWRRSIWMMPHLPFENSSFGQRNQTKGGKNGKSHLLKLVYLHENWKPLWKLTLIQKLCFFKRHWNMFAQSLDIVLNPCIYKSKFPLVQLGLSQEGWMRS